MTTRTDTDAPCKNCGLPKDEHVKWGGIEFLCRSTSYEPCTHPLERRVVDAVNDEQHCLDCGERLND